MEEFSLNVLIVLQNGKPAIPQDISLSVFDQDQLLLSDPVTIQVDYLPQ